MLRRKIKIAAVVAALAAVIVFQRGCVSRSDYDAETIATAETKMWKAYYSGDSRALAWELLILQRTQFELTWVEAVFVARHFCRAAMTFLKSNSGYEEKVLPDLIAAYAKIKASRAMDYDPEAAARAELDWWVARRDPKRSSPESVGAAIGQLYGVLYGEMKDEFNTAGVLRAEAAALRDAGLEKADWQRIEDLLSESYSVLGAGL